MSQIITLSWPSKKLNPNFRGHWAAKSLAVKKARGDAFNATRAAGFSHNHFGDYAGDFELAITFFPPDRRRRDDDNLIASLKGCRDGIAEALGVDDRRFKTAMVTISTEIRNCVEITIRKGDL